MRGDTVIVRGFRGVARRLRVVSVDNSVIQLTDNEGLNAIERGEETEKIVTFRLSDAFRDDGTVKNGTRPRWETLETYSAKVLHSLHN